MKQLLLLVSVITVLLSGCKKDDPEPHPELLVNMDMEAGAAVPNGWWQFQPSGYTTEWTSEEHTSGSKSLKISATQMNAANFAYWGEVYTGAIPTGKDVVFSVKIKCKNVVGQGISIAVRSDNETSMSSGAAQFATSQTAGAITGNFDWTTYNVRLNGLKADTKSLTVYLIFLTNTTGTVYFDDASLKAQ